MIRIVNWILTRKCNLFCDYCAITRNYFGQPQDYPPIDYYLREEMSTYQVLTGLDRIQVHNPECFHIFYGGEPLLRKDLPDIIEHCNKNNIHYTIISNTTKEVQPMIKKLFDRVEVKGFTASIDPLPKTTDVSRYIKTEEAIAYLYYLKSHVKDVVAEVTMMNEDVSKIYSFVKYLSQRGINSDITVVDISKTPYYDFSNVKDKSILVERRPYLDFQFQDIIADDTLDVHMKHVLLPMIYKYLPSEYDCKMEDGLHNLTIDADGSIRLCLRIKGVFGRKIDTSNLFLADEISPYSMDELIENKKKYCKLCNHTCQMMSKYIDDKNNIDDLIHKDKREV